MKEMLDLANKNIKSYYTYMQNLKKNMKILREIRHKIQSNKISRNKKIQYLKLKIH